MRLIIIMVLLACLLSRSLAFQSTPVRRAVSLPNRPRTPSPNQGFESSLLFSPKATTTDDNSEEWTKKRLHNTNWFRSSAILMVLGAAGAAQNSPLALVPAKASAAVHILSFATWFGTVFYTTFVLGLTMFKNLPRQTFGKLQSKLFPKYFSLCSLTIMLQIVTLKVLNLEMTKLVKGSLGCALLLTLFNQFYLEPVSTKVMLERYDLENTDGGEDTDRYKELKASFGKLHGISSLTNLLALICGVIHATSLSSSLLL